jgi:hypothetical protein
MADNSVIDKIVGADAFKELDELEKRIKSLVDEIEKLNKLLDSTSSGGSLSRPSSPGSTGTEREIRLLTELEARQREYANTMNQITAAQARLNAAGEDRVKNLERLRQAEANRRRELSQDVRAEQAAAGSIDQLRAKLNKAQKAYDAMSETMRNSKAGKAAAKNIKELHDKILALERDTGRAQRNVGNYLSQFQTFIANFAANLASDALSSIGDFIGGLIGKFKEFADGGVEMARQAEGILTAFEKLNKPDLLKELRKATKGTVTDLELMKTAIQADNFKIPVERLGSLLRFAQQRAQETGQSVDYLVQSIITGLGRKSTLILDNLGISAAELNAEVKKSGDFMKGATTVIERELEKQGELMETAADREQQRQVKLQNAQLELGQKIQGVYEIWEDLKASFLDSAFFDSVIDYIGQLAKVIEALFDKMSIAEGKTPRSYLKENNKRMEKELESNTEALVKAGLSQEEAEKEAGMKLKQIYQKQYDEKKAALDKTQKQLDEAQKKYNKSLAEYSTFDSIRDFVGFLDRGIGYIHPLYHKPFGELRSIFESGHTDNERELEDAKALNGAIQVRVNLLQQNIDMADTFADKMAKARQEEAEEAKRQAEEAKRQAEAEAKEKEEAAKKIAEAEAKRRREEEAHLEKRMKIMRDIEKINAKMRQMDMQAAADIEKQIMDAPLSPLMPLDEYQEQYEERLNAAENYYIIMSDMIDNNRDAEVAAHEDAIELLQKKQFATEKERELNKREIEKHQKEITAIEKKTEDEHRKNTAEHNEKRLDMSRELMAKMRKEWGDAMNDAMIASQTELEKNRTKEHAELLSRYKRGLISSEKYLKDKQKIEDNYALQGMKSEIDVLKKMLEKYGGYMDDRADLERRLADMRISMNKYANDMMARDDLMAAKERERVFKEFKNEMIQFVNGMVNAQFERTQQRLESEKEAVYERRDEEIKALEESGATQKEIEEGKMVIEARADAQAKAIEQRQKQAQIAQARFEKASALAQVAINTAKAITEVLPNWYLAAAVAVMGAMQAAVISATPIPQYAKGTDDHAGGPAVMGDAGKRELVIEPSGRKWITSDKPTIYDIPKHTVVLPDAGSVAIAAMNADTEKYRRLAALPNANYAQLVEHVYTKGFNEVVRAVKEIPHSQLSVNLDQRGIFSISQNGANRCKYINRNFRNQM